MQCISAFIECCYIACHNAITSSDLEAFAQHLTQFQELRNVFIETGVRESISLPRQHALSHYVTKIELFGSPNGICSSITESLHIRAVKEPWRRSNRFEPLRQMVKTISRLEKLASLRRIFHNRGMLEGTMSDYALGLVAGDLPTIHPYGYNESDDDDNDDDNDDDGDGGPLSGNITLAQVTLGVKKGMYIAFTLKYRVELMIFQQGAIWGRLMRLLSISNNPVFPWLSDDLSILSAILAMPISPLFFLNFRPRSPCFIPPWRPFMHQAIFVDLEACIVNVFVQILIGKGPLASIPCL